MEIITMTGATQHRRIVGGWAAPEEDARACVI
jgi:hypothetical protein